MWKRNKWIQCAGLLGLALVLFSCDNSIDPIDKETGIYAIYGVLDLNKDPNYIRVRDLNAPFTASATKEIDAVVTLKNLDSGTLQILNSVKINHEGIYIHNFVVHGAIPPDTRYRLTVERSDEVTVSLETTTPTRPTPVAAPINQDCYTPITTEFDPVNGSTIVLRVGFPYGQEEVYWTSHQELRAGSNSTSGKISYSFIPAEKLKSYPAENLTCRKLRKDEFYISYTHYGRGFYEKLSNDPFEIQSSTHRFGSLYKDTLTVPVDTSKVCPQDC